MRFVRGSVFDPFGWQRDRRLERRIIADYERWIEQLLQHLNAGNRDAATQLVLKTASIRGFGHIKSANYQRVRDELEAALQQLERPADIRAVA